MTVAGEFRLFEVDENGLWLPRGGWRRNRLVTSWTHVVCQCFGRGDPAYGVRQMYIEFDNGAAPVPVTSFGDDDDSRAYYDSLASSPTRDYLRVAIEAPPGIVVAPGYENRIAADRGNRLVFAAQSGGVQGVHGKPFSAAAGSTVCGVALAASPAPADASADVVAARGYYAAQDQVPKTARQVSILYRVTFHPEGASEG